MSVVIDESARNILARSLPLLHSNRDAIAEAMEASFRAARASEDRFGQPEVAAMVLVDLLLAQGRHLADRGRTEGLEDTLAEHRRLGISGRHYSRFGDALVAILGDVLGPNLPRIVPAVWCDAFWVVIGAVTVEEEMVPA
jgi:hemoglobin-like flavoprotein